MELLYFITIEGIKMIFFIVPPLLISATNDYVCQYEQSVQIIFS